ncbi:MAG: hypothetical protein IJ581_05300 [Paludibacteraceae bacterium]|nr:hypothetical protein [Paludibacteraceae bacterium]
MPAPFAAYMQQTYPNILCEQQGDSQLHIVDKDDSEHDSERYLYFTHLKEDDILALRLHDPKEVQAQGRYQYTHITSPLDDKWPVAKAIRETIAHFQQLADEKKLTAKRK